MDEPIIFKCEDALWQMLADGRRNWDMRLWDLSDERIWRLAWGHLKGQDRWEPDEKWVSFRNKGTDEILTFRYEGVEFTEWAEGWAFFLLGDQVPPENLDPETLRPFEEAAPAETAETAETAEKAPAEAEAGKAPAETEAAP